MIRLVLDRMKRRGFSGLWPPRPHTPSGKKGYRSDFYRPAPSTRMRTLLHRNTNLQGQAQTGLDNNQPIIEMPRLLRTAKSNINADEDNHNIIVPSYFNRPSPEDQTKSEAPYTKKANSSKETSTPAQHPKHQTGPDKDVLNNKPTNLPPEAPALKSSRQGKRDIISLLKQSGEEKALVEAQENETNPKETEQTVLNDQDKKLQKTSNSEKEHASYRDHDEHHNGRHHCLIA